METIGRAPTSHCVSLGRNRWLHVKDWPGGGEPVVLLHGFLDSSAGWDDFARASRRRCVAIDLPGFGGSSAPDQPHLSAYAEDVVAGLRQLGIGSCTLVGHSMGGGVATVLAERTSTEVSSLLLIAPVGFGRLPLAELAVLPIVRSVTAAVMPRVLSKRLLVSTIWRGMGHHPQSERLPEFCGFVEALCKGRVRKRATDWCSEAIRPLPAHAAAA